MPASPYIAISLYAIILFFAIGCSSSELFFHLPLVLPRLFKYDESRQYASKGGHGYEREFWGKAAPGKKSKGYFTTKEQ